MPNLFQVQSPSISRRLAIFASTWIIIIIAGFVIFLIACYFNVLIDTYITSDPWKPPLDWEEFTHQPAGAFIGLPVGYIIGILLSNVLSKKYFQCQGMLIWGIVLCIIGEAFAMGIRQFAGPTEFWQVSLPITSFFAALGYNLRIKSTKTPSLTENFEIAQYIPVSKTKKSAVFTSMWFGIGALGFGLFFASILIGDFILSLIIRSSSDPMAYEWAGLGIAIGGFYIFYPIGLISGILLSSFILYKHFHYKGALIWSLVTCSLVYRPFIMLLFSGSYLLPSLAFAIPPLISAAVFNLKAKESLK